MAVSLSLQHLRSSPFQVLVEAGYKTTHTATRVLRPLEVLDLPSLYAQHATLIDFVLYAMLFNGLAQATLLRRLEGKGGRMVAAAIGTALAISLSVLGARTGFSVMSLGAVAVIVLLGLVGLVLFRTLRRLHVSATAAGGLVLILMSLSVEALAPSAASSLSDIFPIVDLVAALAFLALLWKGLQHLLPKGAKGSIERVADRVESGDDDQTRPTPDGDKSKHQPETEHLKREQKREKPEIGRRLKGIVKRESKESRSILRELQVIKKVLESGKHPAKDRHAIAEAIRRIPPKRHRLKSLIEEVKELDRRLARFDLAVLHELRNAYSKVPKAQQPLLRKLALEERKKIQSERRIQVVEGFVVKYDANTAKCFELGGEAIIKNDTPTAIRWINAAIGYEEEARRMIKRAQSIQSMLARITRLELRQTRRAA